MADNFDVEVFRTRLQKLFVSRGFSGNDIADASGVGRATIYRYLNGTRVPNITSLISISKIFNVSLEYLTGMTDSTAPYSDKAGMTPDERQLIDCFNAASDDDRAIVAMILKKYK